MWILKFSQRADPLDAEDLDGRLCANQLASTSILAAAAAAIASQRWKILVNCEISERGLARLSGGRTASGGCRVSFLKRKRLTSEDCAR